MGIFTCFGSNLTQQNITNTSDIINSSTKFSNIVEIQNFSRLNNSLRSGSLSASSGRSGSDSSASSLRISRDEASILKIISEKSFRASRRGSSSDFRKNNKIRSKFVSQKRSNIYFKNFFLFFVILIFIIFSRRSENDTINPDSNKEEETIELADLKTVTTLGVGGFGRVNLVKHFDTEKVFALKILNKAHVKEMNQQEHVLNERNILISCKSDFIVR